MDIIWDGFDVLKSAVAYWLSTDTPMDILFIGD